MSTARPSEALSILAKLVRLNWPLAILLSLIAGVGFLMLYSVADGNADPWARTQATRYAVCLAGMLCVALIDIRRWYAIAWPLYLLALALLVGVEFFGSVGMGAQRWLELGPLRLQPSELMKIALVLVLARFYAGLKPKKRLSLLALVAALGMIAVPVLLVVKQPDLGTAVLIMASGLAVIFLAGTSLWFFGLLILSGIGAVAAVLQSRGTDWQVLQDYQYDRIAVFLDPGLDPQGAGYHITQSKIALGSGGAYGAGFMQGPQARLDFLPEKQTDFIMTVLGEEFGFAGVLVLLGLYLCVLALGLIAAMRARHVFGKLVIGGVVATFFSYLAINVAMISGMAPVVGVPLPLVSYGGTSMLVLMFGFGLMMNAQLHHSDPASRRGFGA